MKKALSMIIVMILCMGMLPFSTLAADRKPVCRTVIYYNTGEEPKLEVQYEDGDGNDFVELYLLGNKAKNGDMKGPLGLIDISGVVYHLLGIQTIDPSDRKAFHKDEKTGLWVASGKLYLGGGEAPAPGENVGVVIETGGDSGSMRKSDIIRMKVPLKGKKAVYTDAPKTFKLTFKPNGGKGKMGSEYVKAGVKITLPKNAYTRSKYMFTEWNTAKNGSGKAYKDGAKVTLDRDTTLYAQWGEISLKLADRSTVTRGKELTLKATLKVDGKPVKGKKVTFKFKGKTYTGKTNKSGVAKVTVSARVTKKLQAGKSVTVKASFGGVTVNQTIKVK